MRQIRLDAASWSTKGDFYAALYCELRAPDWLAHNLDALFDSLSGMLNEVNAPFTVTVDNTAAVPPELLAFLQRVVTVFADARKEYGTKLYLELQ